MAFPKTKTEAKDEKPSKGAKVIPLAKAKVAGAPDKAKVEAAKTSVKPAPEPKKKAEKKVGRKSQLSEKYAGKRITINCPENPKRGKSAARFALYKQNMKVEDAVAAGVLWADIEYDQKPHSYKDKKGETKKGPFITLK